jgi:hypothetical protein
MNVGPFFITNSQTSKLIQPSECAFDDPSPSSEATAVFGVALGKKTERSASIVPSIPTRGYQLLQLLTSIPIGKFQIDLDFTQNDSAGGQPLWLHVRSLS